MKLQREISGIAWCILNPGTRSVQVVNFMPFPLYLWKIILVIIEQEAGWAPQQYWTFWRRENIFLVPGSKLWFIWPVLSHCTDWATSAPSGQIYIAYSVAFVSRYCPMTVLISSRDTMYINVQFLYYFHVKNSNYELWWTPLNDATLCTGTVCRVACFSLYRI